MTEHAVSLPDTNTIVRYLVKDHAELYGLAEDFFQNVMTGTKKALILESVLAECVFVLTRTYKVPRSLAAKELIGLLKYKGIINNNKNTLITALQIFNAENAHFVDCLLVASLPDYSATLFSFDAKLVKLSKTLNR